MDKNLFSVIMKSWLISSKYSMLAFFVVCQIILSNAQTVSGKWVRQIGGNDYEQGSSLTIDNSGNVFLTGTFRSKTDFDPGVGVFTLTPVHFEDIFVSKFDSAGNFIWAKQIGGGVGGGNSVSIKIDQTGDVIVAGYFAATVDFDPGIGVYNLTANNDHHDQFVYYDVFVLKLNSTGDFIWAKSFGAEDHDYCRSMDVDQLGNIYTTGDFVDSVDFDPGAGVFYITPKSRDIFVSKLDPSGNFIWARSMGSNQVDGAFAINLDAGSNVLLTGCFQDTSDFDPGVGVYNLIASAYYDMFVSKLDALGNFVWAKRISSSVGKAITTDPGGNVFTTGYFSNTGDFDPGLSTYTLSATSTDAFVSKLDAAGNFVWAKQINGNWDENGLSIALDVSGNVYTTGFFQKYTDFDPGVSSYSLSAFGTYGSQDIFISKHDQSGNFIWAKQMGGDKIDIGNCIVVDALDNIYTTGYFTDMADLDPNSGTFNLTSFGSADVFLHRISNGNFVGLEEINAIAGIKIFPNPTTSMINIIDNQNQLQNSTIEIKNYLGQLVFTAPFTSQISLLSLSSGMYFLTLYDGFSSKTVKIIKE